MPGVAGGAPGSSAELPGPPRDGLGQIPAHPFSPPQKSFQKLCNLKTFFRDLVWPYLWFFYLSSMALFFEVIIFLFFEPLGVDFELSS